MTSNAVAMSANEFMNADATVPNGVAATDASSPPPPAATLETEEATAAKESDAKAAAAPMEEPDQSLISVKVAKDFDGTPFLGEITGARKSADGPLYKVEYRDGDTEEFFAAEVKTGQEYYAEFQKDQWSAMLGLIDGLEESVLTGAGITSVTQLELFGGNAIQLNGGTPFDSLELPLLVKQGLFIVATYLLNDQILHKDLSSGRRGLRDGGKAQNPRRKGEPLPPRQKPDLAMFHVS